MPHRSSRRQPSQALAFGRAPHCALPRPVVLVYVCVCVPTLLRVHVPRVCAPCGSAPHIHAVTARRTQPQVSVCGPPVEASELLHAPRALLQSALGVAPHRHQLHHARSGVPRLRAHEGGPSIRGVVAPRPAAWQAPDKPLPTRALRGAILAIEATPLRTRPQESPRNLENQLAQVPPYSKNVTHTWKCVRLQQGPPVGDRRAVQLQTLFPKRRRSGSPFDHSASPALRINAPHRATGCLQTPGRLPEKCCSSSPTSSSKTLQDVNTPQRCRFIAPAATLVN